MVRRQHAWHHDLEIWPAWAGPARRSVRRPVRRAVRTRSRRVLDQAILRSPAERSPDGMFAPGISCAEAGA